MKISAPIYYKDFKCIADRCRHSCCVGWEICIDGDTLSRYGEAKGGYAEKIKSTVREIDGEYSFMLSEGERCPHLDERGLCRIIKSLGEGWLCEICREHPRFYNYVGDCLEVGLGASCEEAARIILSSPDYRSYLAVGEAEGEAAEATLGKVERERVFSFLRDTSRPYAERLEIISRKWRVNPEVLSVEMWREALSQLEYLDERDRELFLTYRSNPSRSGIAEPCERFLAYLIYRHLSPVTTHEALRPTLAFCLFLENLFANLIAPPALTPEEIHTPEDTLTPEDAARIISSEIEYSPDNTEALLAELDYALN